MQDFISEGTVINEHGCASLTLSKICVLEYLAEETDAEEIRVLGYSEGTRLASRAFEQLALIHKESTPQEIHDTLRIGNMILVGSDVGRQVFGSYLADGLLEVPRHLAIYMSEMDKALGVSRFLTRRDRLGQMWKEHPAHLDDYVNEREADVSIINVTQAEGGTGGNGHTYFRNSPRGQQRCADDPAIRPCAGEPGPGASE